MKHFILASCIIGFLGIMGSLWYIGAPSIIYSQGQLENRDVDSRGVSGRQVLTWLNQLQGIKNGQSVGFDLSILKDPAFKSLQDFTVDVGQQDVGRENPFLPASGIIRTQAVTVPAIVLPRAQ